MPGTVLRVEVETGDQLEDGDGIMVLEAMKMETPVKAHVSGTVGEIHVGQGDTVESGQVLVVIN